MRRAHPESEIQQAIISYLLTLGYYPVAVPNGAQLAGNGRQRAMRMAFLKKEGLVPGFPDIVVYASQGRVGHIEVKTEGSYQKPSQKACEAALKNLGHQYAVCRSLDDATETLAKWGWTDG